MSSAPTFTAKEIFELLRDDLQAIEAAFEHGTVSGVPAITDIGAYLRAGGGKRIRPALLLLSAPVCEAFISAQKQAQHSLAQPSRNSE